MTPLLRVGLMLLALLALAWPPLAAPQDVQGRAGGSVAVLPCGIERADAGDGTAFELHGKGAVAPDMVEGPDGADHPHAGRTPSPDYGAPACAARRAALSIAAARSDNQPRAPPAA